MLWKILLIVVLLVTIKCQDQANQTSPTLKIKLDQNNTISVKPNSSLTYELENIGYRGGKNWNLFFVAEPAKGSEWQDLDIHIFRKNTAGNLTKLLGCEDIGVDTCVLQANAVRSDDQLSLEFKCLENKSSCNFSFKAYWSDTYPIVIGRGLRIDFQNEAYAKVFSLDLTNQTYKEVRILLRAQTFLAGTSPIKMVANYGTKTPEFNNYEIASTHLWDDGQGIFLKRVDMRSQKLTILIEGPAENILRLDTSLIDEYNNNLALNIPLYDFLSAESSRSYVVNVSKKEVLDNDIIVKISTFSGRVNVTFYQDEALKVPILGGQFSHHGEIQHRFPRDHLNKLKVKQNLYILIQSPYYASTFVLNVFGKNDTMIKLSNDIEDMAEIYAGEIINYYVQAFLKTNHTQGKQLKFSVHNLLATAKPYFSFCYKDNVSDCYTNFSSFSVSPTRYDTIIPTEITETGTSTIYRLQVDSKMFNQSTAYDNYKKVTVLVLFTSEGETVKQFTIRYIDERVKILRDNHPLKDRLVMGEKRVYRSAPIEDDVIYVAIRLLEISGITKMIGSNTNPLEADVELNKAIIPLKNEIIYYPDSNGRKRTDPLFVTVHGEQNSLYSIVLTFYRNSSISPSPDKGDGFNYVTIPQNVQQQLTIQAGALIAIKLQTNRKDYRFKYTSSYPLKLCLRKNATKFPMDPACDETITETNYKLPNETSVFIGIHNDNQKLATVKVKYSLDKPQCEIIKLGQIWRKNMVSEKSACITYKLSKSERVEVMISLDKLQNKTSQFVAMLNSQRIIFNTPHFIIPEQSISENCPNLTKCDLTLTFENLTGSHVQVVAQIPDKQIILLDGLAQTVFAPSSATVPRYYRYYLVNKINTIFFLESKKGYYEFYVNVVDAIDVEYNWTKLYPIKGNAMFESESSRYTIYNQLTITREQIDNLTCANCVALITVIGAKDEYREQGQFIIEVTQEARLLKEHEPSIGFLAKQSFAFYEFYFPKQNGSLIVSLSTQNTKCGTLYLSKGNLQKASGSNNLNKSESGQLVYNADQGLYSITVEAIGQDCQYVISAASTDFKLYELKPGVYKDIKMKKGEVSYFFYHHISNTAFKVLSIEKYGEVLISAKESNITQLEYLEQNSINKSSFTFKESRDVLLVGTEDSGYKDNVFYLISIEATKPTETSILLYNGDVQIPLSNDDFVTDRMKNGNNMTYKTYIGDSKQINITLDVFYGKIKVTIVELNESKIYKQANNTQIWSAKLERQASFRPVVVKIQALNDTMYSINIKYNTTTELSKMKKGLPTYIFFDNKENKCVQTDYENQDQTLVLSVYKTEVGKLKNLKYTTKVNNVNIKTTSQIVQNTMIISFAEKVQLNSSSVLPSVEYCFTNSDGYLSLTLVSTTSIIYIPEGTVMPVRNEGNFTTYLPGHVWIEILECEGTSSLLLSSEFSKMGSSSSQILYWRKFGNNYIMEVEHYGLVYMNVEGKHSLVRWGNINKDTGEGMGYYAIRMPDYTYQLKDKNITFKIPPVVRLNRGTEDFLSKPNFGSFYLMISPSSRELKKSVQCSQGQSHIESKTFEKLNWQTRFEFVVQVSKLKELYPNEKYLYVGGALELYVNTLDNITESYRFMIQSQQIPWTRAYEDLDDQEDTSGIIDNMKKSGSYVWVIIGLVILLILLVIVCRFFYKRSQLKRNLFMNENSGSLQMRYSEHSVN